MTVERSVNVFGLATTVSVAVPDVVALSAPVQARLEHHVELGLRVLARRLAWHVIDWPKRQAVLRRMCAADAEALGLLPEWRRAKEEAAA